MPDCRSCAQLDPVHLKCAVTDIASEELGRSIPPPPLGNCEIPIVEGYCATIEPGMRVLEIGCGSWSRVRDRCVDVGAHYDGIDILTAESVATRFENLADLSFDDESFDMVIGNQSMEHWAEHACSHRRGLHQCFRVCRTGGKVMLNFPIHFHGTKTFMLGRTDRLARLFAEFSGDVVMEPWGRDPWPHPPVTMYPGYPPLRGKSAYVMDVQATKDRPAPFHDNRDGRSGMVAKLRNKPLTLAVHRAARLAGIVSDPPTRR